MTNYQEVEAVQVAGMASWRPHKLLDTAAACAPRSINSRQIALSVSGADGLPALLAD